MEEMDRFKTAWQRGAAEPSPDARGPATIAALKQRLERLHRAVRRRDRLETGCAAAGIVLFACLLAAFHGTLARLGCAVVVGGLILIIVKLRRARRFDVARRPDLAVRDFCLAELANVDVQIALLRSVAWWYLGPLILGVNLFVAGLAGPGAISFAYLAVSLLAAVHIYRLNARAVVQHLNPIRNQLAGILEQLATAEDAEPGRRGD